MALRSDAASRVWSRLQNMDEVFGSEHLRNGLELAVGPKLLFPQLLRALHFGSGSSLCIFLKFIFYLLSVGP